MNLLSINEGLRKAGYMSSMDIDMAVAGAMDGMALLIEGEPGVGKSCLASATAKMLNLPLIRVQFYEGLTYDKILYDYDYQRQLLTIQAMQPALKEAMEHKSLKEAMDLARGIDFFGKDFLIERPVLKAISGKGRCVLLLDEIDKAAEEIEYMLLEVLEDFSMSIPQYGTVTCPREQRPIVFLTSNHYRELSDALKRRCNYLYIPRKTKEEILEIITMQSELDQSIAMDVASCMEKIQDLTLKQHPSVSEAINWAKYMEMHKDEIGPDELKGTLCFLAKNKEDRDRIWSVVKNQAG